jgi:XTP/dITP diphosphohydrolase
MRIVLATGNAGKLRELQALLAGRDIELVTQAELGISSAAETGLTFVENAILKARHACAGSGLPAIADDSGLEVDALGGRPGVHSARYAGGAGDGANNARLLTELAGFAGAKRTARFRCVLVLLRAAEDASPIICDGVWEGRIAEAVAGDNGFGYDPLFLAGDLGLTAAQLSPGLKSQLSHRGQALRKLIAAIDRSGLGRRG